MCALVFSSRALTKQKSGIKRNPALWKLDVNWTSKVYSFSGFTLPALHCAPKTKKKCIAQISSNHFLASYNSEKVSDIICLTSIDESAPGQVEGTAFLGS